MQKKIIAAAIIGMVSVGASAATVYDKDGTKVSVGGKFDFAVEHANKANKQTLTILDGKYSTSRFTLSGEEAINSDLSAYLGYDLRFSDVFNGKNDNGTVSGTTSTSNGGGIASNDAMKGGLLSKKFGRIEAGTVNVAVAQFVFKKNYVNKSESEIVKYGISNIGMESLSNKTVWAHTSANLPVALKGSVSISDARSGDTAAKKANTYSYGAEFKVNVVNGGVGVVVKPNTNYTGASNQLKHYEAFLAAEKNGKKISFFASHDSDLLNGKSGDGYGINAYYLIGGKWDLGAAFQRYVDGGSTAALARNSGKGHMLGVHYYASKGVTFFAGKRFDNWELNKQTHTNGKFVGNAAGHVGNMTKEDNRTVFGGMNFAF